MKNTKNKILWVTRTALFIAILIVFQSLSASLGQIVTGSLVNLVLITATLTCGFWSGVTVAAISPFFAFLLGIGPKLIQLIPFIALGNIVYVLVAALVVKVFDSGNNSMLFVGGIVGVVVGALLKFATLYFGVIKIFIPLMGENLKQPQIETFTTMFSTPQLITALIGGAVAVPIAMAVRRIIKMQKIDIKNPSKRNFGRFCIFKSCLRKISLNKFITFCVRLLTNLLANGIIYLNT